MDMKIWVVIFGVYKYNKHMFLSIDIEKRNPYE